MLLSLSFLHCLELRDIGMGLLVCGMIGIFDAFFRMLAPDVYPSLLLHHLLVIYEHKIVVVT